MMHASLLLAAALAGASGTVRQGKTDPFDDTFGGFLDQPDASLMTAWYTNESLIVEVRFHAPIMPPDFDTGLGLVGSVEIDVDRDPLTGTARYLGNCPVPRTTGFEAFALLFDFEPEPGDPWRGTAPVVDANTPANLIGTATVVYAPLRVTIEVPLASLPNGSGEVDAAVIVGTPSEPTDCAPNVGVVSAFDRVFGDGLEP